MFGWSGVIVYFLQWVVWKTGVNSTLREIKRGNGIGYGIFPFDLLTISLAFLSLSLSQIKCLGDAQLVFSLSFHAFKP